MMTRSILVHCIHCIIHHNITRTHRQQKKSKIASDKQALSACRSTTELWDCISSYESAKWSAKRSCA